MLFNDSLYRVLVNSSDDLRFLFDRIITMNHFVKCLILAIIDLECEVRIKESASTNSNYDVGVIMIA